MPPHGTIEDFLRRLTLASISNNKITKIRKLANLDFSINRPYWIRLNLLKNTILFNRELNMPSETDTGNLDTLPVEPYGHIEDIPWPCKPVGMTIESAYISMMTKPARLSCLYSLE